MTGLSGSGKSSLAFDTIYAEGQRRYVESLSAYARQFLEMMQKPDVDQIDGLSPAISIEQKTTSRNPRSTVGTVTEIYDYMRLLFARVGIPYSPATGLPIESQTVSQMVDRVMALEEGTRLYLLAPIVRGRKGEYRKEFADLMKKGFQRVKVDGSSTRSPTCRHSTRNTSTISTSWWTASWCAMTSRRALPTAFETASGCGRAGHRRICRQAAADAETSAGGSANKSLNETHERITFSEKFACPVSGFTIPRSSHGCSPSTTRMAPARPAMALAPSCASRPTCGAGQDAVAAPGRHRALGQDRQHLALLHADAGSLGKHYGFKP
jgi:excinuclease ABC subunit A